MLLSLESFDLSLQLRVPLSDLKHVFGYLLIGIQHCLELLLVFVGPLQNGLLELGLLAEDLLFVSFLELEIGLQLPDRVC